MNEPESLSVMVGHDKVDDVWYVVSSGIIGLHVESPTFDELVEVVSDLSPDLISANMPGVASDIPICIQYRFSVAPLA